MNILNNMKTAVKLFGGFSIVAALLIIVAVLGYTSMKTINDGMTSMYYDRLLPIKQLGNADSAMFKMRGDVINLLSYPTNAPRSTRTYRRILQISRKQWTNFGHRR